MSDDKEQDFVAQAILNWIQRTGAELPTGDNVDIYTIPITDAKGQSYQIRVALNSTGFSFDGSAAAGIVTATGTADDQRTEWDGEDQDFQSVIFDGSDDDFVRVDEDLTNQLTVVERSLAELAQQGEVESARGSAASLSRQQQETQNDQLVVAAGDAQKAAAQVARLQHQTREVAQEAMAATSGTPDQNLVLEQLQKRNQLLENRVHELEAQVKELQRRPSHGVIDAIQGIFTNIVQIFKDFVNGIKDLVSSIKEKVTSNKVYKEVNYRINNALDHAAKGVQAGAKHLGSGMQKTAERIGTGMQQGANHVGSGIQKGAQQVVEAVQQGAQHAGSGIQRGAQHLASGMSQGAAGLGERCQKVNDGADRFLANRPADSIKESPSEDSRRGRRP